MGCFQCQFSNRSVWRPYADWNLFIFRGCCNVVRGGNLHFQRVGVGPRRPHHVFIGVLMAHLRPWRESSNLWSWRRVAAFRPPRNMGRQTTMMGTFLQTATGFRSFQVTVSVPTWDDGAQKGWENPAEPRIDMIDKIEDAIYKNGIFYEPGWTDILLAFDLWNSKRPFPIQPECCTRIQKVAVEDPSNSYHFLHI